MSTRLITTLAAVSASLLMMVGCATGDSGEDSESDSTESTATESSDSADMPKLETSVKTESTGFNCSCPAGQELSGGLCYPKCAAGWSGEGPVCWQTCASGFTDTGWFCQRNSKIISSDHGSCPWYNKCGLGSSCSKCPAGYSNDGCTCRVDAYIYAQPSYGRGGGSALSCTGN